MYISLYRRRNWSYKLSWICTVWLEKQASLKGDNEDWNSSWLQDVHFCWSISNAEKERRPTVKLKCKQEREVMRLGKIANGVINATAKANGCVGLVSTCWKLSHYLELYMNKKMRVLQFRAQWEWKVMWGVGLWMGTEPLAHLYWVYCPYIYTGSRQKESSAILASYYRARTLGWESTFEPSKRSSLWQVWVYSLLHWLLSSLFWCFLKFWAMHFLFAVSRKG